MKTKVTHNWPTFRIDSTWSLFLDRDGVINSRIVGDYVRDFDQFKFLPGVLDAISVLSGFFNRICVVTNQAGIEKGLYSHDDLAIIHEKMLEAITYFGGHVDNVYYCPFYLGENIFCRKPNPGMALQAKSDFPDIEFKKSVMVGDSLSDIAFGNRLGMKTILLGTDELIDSIPDSIPDCKLDSLTDVSQWIMSL
ncbi:MAG: HAD-IIIA family hydrolase [Saprospiraceae bacterium]